MILQNAVILSLIVYFIHVCFYWEGMIFQKAGDWLESFWPEWMHKTLFFGCPICSTPWWGAVFYWLLHYSDITGFEDARAVNIITTLFTAAGIAVLLVIASKFFAVLNLMEERYEE